MAKVVQLVRDRTRCKPWRYRCRIFIIEEGNVGIFGKNTLELGLR